MESGKEKESATMESGKDLVGRRDRGKIGPTVEIREGGKTAEKREGRRSDRGKWEAARSDEF